MINNLKKLMYRAYIKIIERRFRNVKYLFMPGRGGIMIVSFAGFSPDFARYNYINTLKDLRCSKLFVLDDHGFQKRGSYYLDTVEETGIKDNVIELVNKIRNKHGIKKIITVGSSKGGSCALLFGKRLDAEACIIGAPQYYIGDYLNIDGHRDLLKAIIGAPTPEKINVLNHLISDTLKQGNRDMEVFLHYSKFENTFRSQIVYLLSDLKDLGYKTILDDNYVYTTHSEVSKYFPAFLKKTCQEYIKKDENM